MTTVFQRLASVREVPLLWSLRDLGKGGDRHYSRDQILAMTTVITDDAICQEVLEIGRARGLIA
jgi:hypothetical protein